MTDLDPRWYAKLYDRLGERYRDLEFTKGSVQEVDFLEEEMRLIPGSRILDVGCGAGRHAIELAARGYEVTGVDLSGRLLALGLEEAKEREVLVHMVNTDARRMEFASKFHAAVCLCEGGFGILESDQEHLLLLRTIRKALEPGAVFALNAENLLYVAARPDEFPGFDPETNYTISRETLTMESGRVEEVALRTRSYAVPELVGLLKEAGFRTRDVYGVNVGDFARDDVTADARELLAVAEAA